MCAKLASPALLSFCFPQPLASPRSQELLLERADLFYGICPSGGGGALTPDQIKDITELLQEDVRWVLPARPLI